MGLPCWRPGLWPRLSGQGFFTRDLSAEGLLNISAKVNEGMTGKVALKLHTGEPNGPNILPRPWVQRLQASIPDSTIVECNVLYESPRQTTEGHREALKANGWTFLRRGHYGRRGRRQPARARRQTAQEAAVGKHLLNYDSLLALTHFKGHVMGGFGGSLKNIAIGCASGKVGKAQLHREGNQPIWSGGPNFMERMVEGGKAVTSHFGPHIAYINVLRNMSVSCDCEGVNAAPVTLPDLGILASTDILAVTHGFRGHGSTPCQKTCGAIWWSASNPAAACVSFPI